MPVALGLARTVRWRPDLLQGETSAAAALRGVMLAANGGVSSWPVGASLPVAMRVAKWG